MILEEPAVRIGDDDSRAGHDLHRVFAGLIGPAGRIVLGNSASGELRFFDTEGNLLHAVGRTGDGPGEYRLLSWMSVLPEDSILVFDGRAHRFSVLTPAGAFVRSFQLEFVTGPTRVLGTFSDGSILLASEGAYDPRAGAGVVRDSATLIRFTPEGARADTVGRFAGAEWLLFAGGSSFRAVRLPFGRESHVVAAGNHFFHAESDADELHVYTMDGEHVGSISLAARPRLLGADEIARYLEENVGGDDAREAVRRHLRAQGGSHTAPVVAGIASDREGRVWVQLFPEPGASTSRWLIVDASGGRIGDVRLPTAHLLLDAHAEWLLVRETDPDGVQRVSLRALEW